MPEHKLRLDAVSKAFPTKTGRLLVLDRISLGVAVGEVVAIVGPSGCGKSTLLRLAAGLARPDTGYIFHSGVDVTGPSPACGVVFQDYALFPWRTVRGNIGFGLEAARMPSGVVARHVDDWISRIGLTGFAEYYPAELSGGMRQRVALARTLIMAPPLVLLDEPFASLDTVNRRALQDLLQQLLAEEDRTALFITHDSAEAVYLADRVVVLSAAPALISGVVDIPVARPRSREDVYAAPLLDRIKAVDRLIPG